MDRADVERRRYTRLEVTDVDADVDAEESSSAVLTSEKDALLPKGLAATNSSSSLYYTPSSSLSSSLSSSSSSPLAGILTEEPSPGISSGGGAGGRGGDYAGRSLGASLYPDPDEAKGGGRATAGAPERGAGAGNGVSYGGKKRSSDSDSSSGGDRASDGRGEVVIEVAAMEETGDGRGGSVGREGDGGVVGTGSALKEKVLDVPAKTVLGDGESTAAECRICQEEDDVKNLETPCACSGSVKYAHRKCIQRWCNEKGDTICELCHQRSTTGNEWAITLEHRVNLQDPRVIALAAAERFALEDEYAVANATGAAWCRSAALILMSLLLLRHALALVAHTEPNGSTVVGVQMLMIRVIGFLLPCYIMAQAFSILHKRRQQQEAAIAAAEAAAEMALILQSEQGRSMRITIAPPPPAEPAPQRPEP
ncbi:hypothetical protein CBR_g4103 [Chara braunii]|uniref:RING-CH-type domain-containing protein n=1 Tax=Chara braunii TaxID=69332 RepID=A0A388KHB9_CHABU|nr:hypothetical protein CBR_g4103 [Chara braunii]|eukprot:GBG69408.1 hypothetical protein CBR_g4103 [Chara braunii]